MAEELPSLHIDTDWKKQAQEEKRRIVEEQQRRQAAAPPVSPTLPSAVGAAQPAAASRGRRQPRELPQASFPTLVQSLLTQALYYLGELSGDGTVNLDLAKHHIDQLGVLEQKTVNNLDEVEQKALDTALYETRARFVSVASQYI